MRLSAFQRLFENSELSKKAKANIRAEAREIEAAARKVRWDRPESTTEITERVVCLLQAAFNPDRKETENPSKLRLEVQAILIILQTAIVDPEELEKYDRHAAAAAALSISVKQSLLEKIPGDDSKVRRHIPRERGSRGKPR